MYITLHVSKYLSIYMVSPTCTLDADTAYIRKLGLPIDLYSELWWTSIKHM